VRGAWKASKDIVVSSGVVEKLGLKNEQNLQRCPILSTFIKFLGMPQSLSEVNVGRDNGKQS